MKIIRVTLRYTISTLLVLLALVLQGQEKLERQVFVRAGLDLSRFALPFMSDYGPSGLELSLDTELKYRYFPTIEAGFSEVSDETSIHSYHSQGNYVRLGLNYNMINYKHRLDRNIFFVGARFAFAGFSHEADPVFIQNNWGRLETSLPSTALRAQWFEGVIGLRGEIVKNFYMGFTIRIKSMLFHSDYGNFTPYWVPGYGEATKAIATGISYSVFYAIPLKKLKLDFEE